MGAVCRRYLVSGRVQGVFFRDSTRQRARQSGLCGWVRNLVDGRVETLICGDEQALAEMEIWLRSGPEQAKVTNIERIDAMQEAAGSATGFEILPTASID